MTTTFLDAAFDHAAMLGVKLTIRAVARGRWACRLEDEKSGRPEAYGQSPGLAARNLMLIVNERLERLRAEAGPSQSPDTEDTNA